jgi:hypothetical protein
MELKAKKKARTKERRTELFRDMITDDDKDMMN